MEAAIVERPAWRVRANVLGLWCFIASESFLFGAVIAARYILLGVSRPPELNQPLGFAISLVLILSSLTAYRAETLMAHDDRAGFLRNVTWTILLGLLFLVGVAVEWAEGLRSFPPSTPFGSAFFSLIGLHAFHVFTGVLALAVVRGMAARGRFGSRDHWGVEAVVKYWHFVDVAWVVIFPTIYLVS
jgi:cytochrome c oxidase subunit 3